MVASESPIQAFRAEAVEALARAAGVPPEVVDKTLDVAEIERGDFAFPCFPLAKERKAPPPKIAAEIAAKFQAGGRLAKAVAVGPYVNVFVDRARMTADVLAALGSQGTSFGESSSGRGKTVVIDFSAPNVAKPLAFHHLRSTMIGNALAKVYRAAGWRVVGINYLGDWGTGFGKLLLAIETWGDDALRSGDPRRLNELYVRVNAEIKANPALADGARAWFKRLEDGDARARDLWRQCVAVSMKEFDEVYRWLGVTFDVTSGEAFFEDKMPAVVDELRTKGLLEESEGALVVRVGDDVPPCLIMKSDGATLYATRDLAAAEYRKATYGFDRALYVVASEQALHFKQWIRVLERAGHAWAATIRHVPFGIVLMGGSKAKTRAGNVVLLLDVLGEAVEKVKGLMREKNPDLEDLDAIARQVGVGAVVFNDLKNRRTNDVEFDLDAILSFEGKTGPYVMYSHARACSILRKHGSALPPADPGHAGLLSHPTEYAIVRLIARFPDRVARAVDLDEPSEVATHLLDLCEAFHAYHTQGGRDTALRVLCEDPTLRAARLRLTDAVRQTLVNGLSLLGIAAPSAM